MRLIITSSPAIHYNWEEGLEKATQTCFTRVRRLFLEIERHDPVLEISGILFRQGIMIVIVVVNGVIITQGRSASNNNLINEVALGTVVAFSVVFASSVCTTGWLVIRSKPVS